MRILASKPAEVEMNLTIKGTPEAMRTLSNLLGAIQRNTGVGHSCVHAAFFDGDGADKISIDGLPDDSVGSEMAAACSSYGDGFCAMFGANTAVVYNTGYAETAEGPQQTIRSKEVWPEVSQ